MLDHKPKRQKRTKANRLKGKQPRNWKRLFHRLLMVSVFSGALTLIVVGSTLVAQVLLDSDYFKVDTITVNQVERVAREEILDLADIREGLGIFDIDLDRIGAKIEENPWIAQAQVSRIFPRKVAIRVLERQPLAIVNLGYLYYVDGSGEIFKLLDRQDSLDLPVITGISREEMLSDPANTRQRLQEALALLKELKERRYFNLEDVSEIHSDPVDGLIACTYIGGIPVRLGVSSFGHKLDRLERIYKELEPRLMALKYIDLNVPDRVIVKVDPQHRLRT